MSMTFGLHAIQQDASIDEFRRLWRWADGAGFDWISTCDHFEESPPRDRTGDCFEAVATMTAIACETRHVRVGLREDQLEEYAQCLRMLFDQPVSTFKGGHYALDDARCNPKPVQKHVRIWIGGLGEKRTLPAAAKYADGWNGPYLGPEDFIRKSRLLDELCARNGRDP